MSIKRSCLSMGFLAIAASAVVTWGQGVQFASPGQRLPGDRLKWDSGFQLLDMNGDGLLDIFMPVGGFEGTSVHMNIGTRENPRFDFEGMMAVNLTEATAGSPAWQSLEHTQAVAIGDLDGNGMPDMLAYDGRMRLLFGQGVNEYSVGWWDQPSVEGERFVGHDGTRSFPSSAQTRQELERFVTGPESMMWSKGIFARRVLTLGIEDWDGDGRNDMLVNLFDEDAPGIKRMVAVENEYWSAWGRTGINSRDWNHPTDPTYHGPLSFKPARRTFWYRNVGPDRAYFADKQEFLSAGQPVDAPNPVLFDFTGNGFQDLFGTEVAYTGNAYRVDWPTSAYIEYYPASSADPASLGAKTILRDAQNNPIPAGVQLRFADYRGVGVKDLFVMDVGGTLRWYRNSAQPGQAAVFQSPPQIISGTEFQRFMSDYQPLVVNWFGPDSRDLIVHGVIDTHCKYGLRRTALYRNVGGPGRVKYAFEGWLNVNGDPALVSQDWPHQDMAQDAFASMIGVMPVDTWTNPRLVVSVSGRLTLISGLQADKLTFTTRTPLSIPNPGRNRHTGGWQTVPVNQSARYIRLGNNDIVNGVSTVYPMGHERDGYLAVRRLEALSGGVNVATTERNVTVLKTDGSAFRSDFYPTNMLIPGENLENGTLPAFSNIGGYQGPAVVDLKANFSLGDIRILLSGNQWRSYGYNLPGGTWLPYFWQNQAFSHGVDKGTAWHNYKVEVSSDNQTWTTVADRMDTEMAYSFPYLMDWNGDGKVDLLLGVVHARVTRPVTNEIRLYLNQGSNESPLYTTHSVLLTRPAHPDKPGHQCSFQILQEDGQKKLVVYDNSTSGAGAGGTRKEIFTLQGGVYQTTGTFLGAPYPINFRTSGWQYTHFNIADVVGDGIPDLLDNSGRNGIVFFKGTRATAPAGVETFRRIGGTGTSATLRWSKPANATDYEVRWIAGEPINDVNWGDANVVGGTYSGGTEQDAVVSGLPAGQRIYLAVKSRNANNEWSPIGNVIDTVTGPQERRVFRNGAAGGDGEVAYSSSDAVAIYGENWRRDSVGSRDLWLASGPPPGAQPTLVLVKFTDLPQMTGSLSRARLQIRTKPTEAIWNDPISGRMPVPPSMDTHNISVYTFDHDWDPAVVSFNTRKTGEGWSQSLLNGGTFQSHHTPYWSVWTNTTMDWDVTEALRNVIQNPNGAVGFLVRIDYYGIYSANQSMGFLGVGSGAGRPQLVLEFGETTAPPAACSAPVFSPAAGTYTNAQSVAIASATSGATIRYTTDGSTPSATHGTVYAGAVQVGQATTLKAIAYKSELSDSTVTTGSYTIQITPPPSGDPGTVYVSPSGNDAQDGSSWANAVATLGKGVQLANAGDVILVHDGTYTVSQQVVVDKAVTLRSVNGAGATVVDGNNATRVFRIAHADAKVDGFTVKRGVASAVTGYGTAGYTVGGGVLLEGGLLMNSSVLTNSANQGGGVFFAGASSVVSNCLVQGNTATRNGGGLSNNGQTLGGKLLGNTIRNNSGWGGGVWIDYGHMENNVVAYNSDPANYSGGIRQRGGTNRNSLVFRNTAASATGGGLYVSHNGLVENATVAYNTSGGDTADRSSGIRALDSGDASVVRNTVVRGNTFGASGSEVQLAPGVSMTYSCWPDGTTGTGNLSSNPQFVDAASDIFSLDALSPCLNLGQNQAWMTGATDVAGGARIVNTTVDMGAYERGAAVTTLHVAPGGSDAASGAGWSSALATLGAAVAKANAGDLILVTNGTYTVSQQVVVDRAVTLRSVNGADATVVDGNNATRVFRIAHADAVVDGFTVRRGVGSVVTGYGTGGFSVGGGVLLDGGLLANCSVLTNSAAEGGGVFFAGSASVVSNCLVQGNTATRSGGGLSNVGQASGGRLVGNTIRNNSGWGGVWIDYGHMENNVVAYNSDPANYSGGIRQRGGTNRNSLVYRNTAASATGGGLYVSHHGLVENATVAYNTSGGNTADRSAGLRARDDNDNSVVRNTVVWGNTFGASGSEVLLAPGVSTTYSCWPNGTSGTGNLSSNPLFVDAAADSFALSSSSPCVDTGVNQAWMSGASDVAGGVRIFNATVDMGAYETGATVPTLYVAPGGSDAASGAGWTTALATLGAAVAQAASGDLILVNDGTYTVSQQVVVDKAVTLRSVNGAGATVVDGNNATRVFRIAHADAVVDGFTIQRGVGSVVSGYGTGGFSVGGGVLMDGGLLANCSVLTNSAAEGGGVFFAGSASVVSNCLVQGNTATRGGGGLSNVGQTTGGKLFGNTIRNNSGWGGVWIDYGHMENNVVAYNSDPANYAGGIRQRGGTNRNSLVYRNTAASATGGGLYVSHNGLVETATVAYNTSGGNTADRSSGLRASDFNDTSVIRNTVVWGNTFGASGSEIQPPPLGSVTYSCWPNGTSGTGNISSSPLFVDAAADNFSLSSSSPCVDTGANQAWMNGATDVAGGARIVNTSVDRGAFERGGGMQSFSLDTALRTPVKTLELKAPVIRRQTSRTAGESQEVVIRWESEDGKLYRIDRSPSLGQGTFQEFLRHIPATPPENTEVDTDVHPQMFYRVSEDRR